MDNKEAIDLSVTREEIHLDDYIYTRKIKGRWKTPILCFSIFLLPYHSLSAKSNLHRCIRQCCYSRY